MAHLISMEKSLPTKDESKNDGETSRGQDQTVVPTDADWTSPGSDWVLNRCNISMELRSSLDDMGYPIEKNEGNPTKVTCPKVPLRLRKSKGSEDYFDPAVISFGPYHHGKRELQEIDTIKDEVMLKFIKESGKSFLEFYYKLKLPPLILTYDTTIVWKNLVAFELSTACETQIVITSYVNFLNALIANPDDVKELRSKRILLNAAGSDEEMFKFFKEICTDSIQDNSIYRNVREDIEKHCRSKIRTWAAEIIYKYFRNPWSALGLFAATAVVVLSFVQTYFTIYSGKR
ncbi:uncharacterized protein LOC115984205 isoform X2 [Quercus lobata]|uniref:uncharacterized protein LOC115984205 isoform X2 n=1 Tax=Quercus lobata TaxID=97700 RepID=UPI00124679EA|nr:uncharacterized protein LOC115984205 isoform X2 [Quercus lobata]